MNIRKINKQVSAAQTGKPDDCLGWVTVQTVGYVPYSELADLQAAVPVPD
jgi:hypothetical protein